MNIINLSKLQVLLKLHKPIFYNQNRKCKYNNDENEKTFLINLSNLKIESVTNGEHTSVNMKVPSGLFNNKRYKLLHGHPELCDNNGQKYTLPVSFTDFEFLNKNDNLQEITAVNKYGHESTLRKSIKFKKITNNKLDELRYSYFETLYNLLCNKNEKEKIKELNEYVKKIRVVLQ